MIEQAPIEIQYNSNNSTEISYRVNSELGKALFTKASSLCSTFLLNSQNIELISHSPQDDLSVAKSSIALVFNQSFLDLPHLSDYHVLKVSPNGSTIRKDYDNDFWRHPNISLPQESRLAQQFGIGFYSDEFNIDLYDMYFFHNSLDIVESHFKLKIPLPESVREQSFGLYGISYNSKLEPLKLKRYFFPSDPSLTFPEKL